MPNSIETPPNSIWPNGLKLDSEEYVIFYPLGTNKVDISTVTWPEGDKLISPYVYQNDKLVGFVDTKALIVSGTATTTMNYNHIEADFASISEGALTVNAPNATVKKFKWAVSPSGSDESFDFVIIDFTTTDQETINTVRTAKRVVDNKLYDENDDLIGTWDTSKIEVAGFIDDELGIYEGLFSNMEADGSMRGLILSEFNSDLSSLMDGSAMFFGCDSLSLFSSDLSSLTIGSGMFAGCYSLTSFDSDLSSLTDGNGMFISCTNLNSFSSNLSSLTDGKDMFVLCENLTSFTSDLSSLTNGDMMFHLCKLDGSSVRNIIDTISTNSGEITIGLGCDNTTEDNNLFVQEVGYDDINSFIAALVAKKWNFEFQCNGRPTTTYGLRRPSGNTLPVFAKLEEEEKHANYISIDGSKKYRLRWFHMTTGSTDGYTQYATLEEAIESLNIKPIERN